MEFPCHYLILENSVKSNSIFDSLYLKNVSFGVEKKVSDPLWILTKREDTTLTQLYCAPVLNNTVNDILVLWFSEIYFKTHGFYITII